MKNKGFTLVELLAVIVILGLILAIAIPSSFKLSKNVKTKAYKTKIEQIEKGAGEMYGTNNIGVVRTSNSRCAFKFDENDELENAYFSANGTFSESEVNSLDKYPCIRLSVNDLVASGNLDYDHKNLCKELDCPQGKTEYYDNVIINPVDNYIINECYVYVYYKYNRAYAIFDKKTCDQEKDLPDLGHSYKKATKKMD